MHNEPLMTAGKNPAWLWPVVASSITIISLGCVMFVMLEVSVKSFLGS